MASVMFSPLSLRGMTMPNRITVAPMCQYSATDGVPSDWHVVHLGQFAQSGAGLIFVEATGVSPQGRITPGCTGLYSDACEEGFARVLQVCRALGRMPIGMQLAHAGRKASTTPPWEGGGLCTEGGWTVEAPSAVPYLESWATPEALDEAGLARVRDDFVAAAGRAARLGFDTVQLHAAHGYLLHQFLSPLSNRRNDAYGGSLEGRMRFPLEVFEAVRAAFPEDRPVMVRISASDWIEGGWDLEQSIEFCQRLKALGCDMIDVSSGGLDQRQQIVTGPGYQVHFAEAIRREVGMPVMAVGQITEPLQAETILRTGQADSVALARGMLWDPRWPWHAAAALGEDLEIPAQYLRANPALRGKPFVTRR